MTISSINFFTKLSYVLSAIRIYFAIVDLFNSFKNKKSFIFMLIYTIAMVIFLIGRLFFFIDIYKKNIYLLIMISYFIECVTYIFMKRECIKVSRLIFYVISSLGFFFLLAFIYPYFKKNGKAKKIRKIEKLKKKKNKF